MNSGRSTRKFGYVFFGLAVVSLAVGIFVFVNKKEISNLILAIISGALWSFCGIMVIMTAKNQEIEETKVAKTTAFNYGKKKSKKK